MGDLIEEIDKYLGCIPDDILDNPNQMTQLIVDAKARIGELEKELVAIKSDLEDCAGDII